MRDRKKRNIIIGSLCCLLVFMGIGYAILSQTLNISGIANMRGNWNVKITNMELLSENKTGRAEEVSHSFTDTTATFTANLYMPGDSIEYRVTVENQGNIDALLKSITPTTTNRSAGIKFSHSEIDNTVLTAGKTITFTMKVEFLEDATSIPKVENVKYNLELVYVQYNGGEYTPAVEPIDNSCFVINTAGAITGYDYNCGTVVTVPAEIDGIQVKSIAANTFTDLDSINMWMYSKEESATVTKHYYIFKDQEARSLYLELTKSTQEELDAEENTYNYLKGDTALQNIDLGVLEGRLRIFRNANGEIDVDYNAVPLTELDLSHADYLESIDLGSAPNLKKWNLNTKKPITFNSFTVAELEELIINVEAFNNTKKIPYKDGTKKEAFSGTHIKKLIILDESTTHKLEVTNTDEYGLFLFGIDSPGIENVIIDDGITELGINSLGNLDIKSITLPNTLTTIGDDALDYNELTSITIPSSVETIGVSAFEGNQITTINFESNSKLKTIGEKALYDNKLTSITIPSSVETIGNDAFGNNKLTSITIPSSVETISNGAFGSNQLTSITIPSSVETIGAHAFVGNQITTINFESNSKLKTIGAYAFRYNKLTSITIPSSVETISDYAFDGNQLTSITIPSSVETIDGSAFSNNQITTINFESNSKLKTIGGGALENNKLTSITIPSSVEEISVSAFASNQITTINFESNSKLKAIFRKAFAYNKLTNASLGKLPSSLTRLDTDAFYSNPDLTQITLTSPKDLSGWPNGGTVDGKTVVYER